MFTKGKYVVGEIPVMFGSALGAVCVNEAFGHDTLAGVFLPDSILSAGFFHINDDLTVSCYGESVGLNVKSRPGTDEKLLAKTLALPSAYI